MSELIQSCIVDTRIGKIIETTTDNKQKLDFRLKAQQMNKEVNDQYCQTFIVYEPSQLIDGADYILRYTKDNTATLHHELLFMRLEHKQVQYEKSYKELKEQYNIAESVCNNTLDGHSGFTLEFLRDTLDQGLDGLRERKDNAEMSLKSTQRKIKDLKLILK